MHSSTVPTALRWKQSISFKYNDYDYGEVNYSKSSQTFRQENGEMVDMNGR